MLSNNADKKPNIFARYCLCVLSFIFLCFLTYIFSTFVDFFLKRHNLEFLNNTVTNVTNIISFDLEEKRKAFRRMAMRWSLLKKTSPETFENEKFPEILKAEAKRYLNDMSELQSIEYVNAQNKIQWVIPIKENQLVLGYDLRKSKEGYEALLLSKKHNRPSNTPPIILLQGKLGMLEVYPINKNESVNGYILAVYDLKKLFNDFLQKSYIGSDLDISIYINNTTILSENKQSRSNFFVSKSIPMLDQAIKVKLIASQFWVLMHQTFIVYGILIGGILISFFISSLIYFIQKYRAELNSFKIKKMI